MAQLITADTFRGCLVGGAVGDALGYAVEFLSLDQIRAKYGYGGITEYELRDGLARISDDTQMTLFTVSGLLAWATHQAVEGVAGTVEHYVSDCYKDWLRTQDAPCCSQGGHDSSWLMRVPELCQRRAPGTTCTKSLREGMPVMSSKGCGGVMRVAPVGLFFDGSPTRGNSEVEPRVFAAIQAASIVQITHGHELGFIPAAAFAYIISSITYYTYTQTNWLEAIIADCIVTMDALYSGYRHISDFCRIMTRAVELAQGTAPDTGCIQELGQGWVGEEALAIAVFCALRHQDSFEDAIVAAVNHSGDSDSTGSIAGSILGARCGYDALPARLTKRLELRHVILEIAEDLWQDCRVKSQLGSLTPDETIWLSKYYRPSHADR
ncbi:MAG: ADP-ribosylglycohydrolase family protein [Coriobacteriales bacterium]|nr:ADP-ribosylglycohydrolase family protein [Coriobacteriales bacterium]